ncbi:hypothetical protein DL96DRAFT_1714811 [Flagelloscypha sp. PMI_526]|nr:hypothetical protein DL96DRAFT_1714811 [Flagelloscypha sp. PMI_526]
MDAKEVAKKLKEHLSTAREPEFVTTASTSTKRAKRRKKDTSTTTNIQLGGSMLVGSQVLDVCIFDRITSAAPGGDNTLSFLSSTFVHKPLESSSRQPTPQSTSPPTSIMESSSDAFVSFSRAADAQFLAGGQEPETRRPEYLKRHKRTLAEADSTTFDDDRVGIFDGPHKGRRITFSKRLRRKVSKSLLRPVDMGAAVPLNGFDNLSLMSSPSSKLFDKRPPSENELRKRKRLTPVHGDATPWGPISKLAIVDNATAETANITLKRTAANAAKKGKRRK